jgi:protein TonB
MTGPPSGPAPNLAGVAGMTGVAGAGEVAGSSGSGQSGVGAQGRVPVSSGEMVGLLERQVAPVYPLNAKALHVQGLVVLHAVISKTGDVESVQVISGPPLLLKAAIDAVMRWKYRPYLRNGVPAEVVTTINVNFIL